jgi:hypothetical protein
MAFVLMIASSAWRLRKDLAAISWNCQIEIGNVQNNQK